MKTKDLVLISLFAALMVVGAMIKIPNPFNPAVPITLQLFFAVFAGLLLGARKGLFSMLLYLLLGLVGLPVFSSGGGPGYVLQPTFGYLIGFAVTAWIIGLFVDKMSDIKFVKVFGAAVIGCVVAYIIGNIYFYFIMNLYLGKAMGLVTVFSIMTPYFVKDLVLTAVAASTAVAVIPTVRRSIA